MLRRVDGVQTVEVNPVSQTATVAYDPTRADIATLRAQVRECGQACAGESVPQHICDPMHRTHTSSTDTAHRDHRGPEQPMSEHGDTMSHAGTLNRPDTLHQ